MADNRKETENGIYYFTRSQLAVLATVTTVVTVIIFFLGMLIGQRIEERKLAKKEEPVVKIPVPSLAPGAEDAPKEELTFYDTLGKAPAKAQPSPSEKTAKEVKPESKTAAKDSKPEAQKVKPIVKEVKIVTKGEAVQPGQNVKERVERISPQKKTESAAVKAGRGKQDGAWAVQVNAFPHERDAKDLVKTLSDKGYDAYTVAANINGRTWYRVRVGRLATRDEARTLQETLKKKEKYANAITVSR